MREGWIYKKLGEVCSLYQPKTISSDMLVSDGDYPVYGANGIIGRYNQYNHEFSEVLVTCRGATCGTINITTPYSWINGNAMVIHPNNDDLSKTYLAYALRGIDLSDVITGAAQPQITRQTLSPKKLPIPPLSEQERIVSELDLLSSIIEKKKEQLKAYDQLAQSIFYDMFGDPIENPKGWEIKRLEECVSSDCSISYGIVQPGEDVQDGVPVVRPIDLTNTFVYRKGLKVIDKSISDTYKRTILKGNEILFCVRGTTGIISFASEELRGCNVTRGITPLSFDEHTNKYFIFYLIKSDSLQSTISEHTRGIALKQINMKDVRQLPIPLPPLSLQQSFASKIESIEHQKSLIQQSIVEMQTMFDFTMDKYFG